LRRIKIKGRVFVRNRTQLGITKAEFTKNGSDYFLVCAKLYGTFVTCQEQY
jgi:hypothetical protein